MNFDKLSEFYLSFALLNFLDSGYTLDSQHEVL